jgi:hypothetical protein
VVNRFFSGQRLDPQVVDVYPGQGIRWKSFYDIDDILAFPVRELFGPNEGIVDFRLILGTFPMPLIAATGKRAGL